MSDFNSDDSGIEKSSGERMPGMGVRIGTGIAIGAAIGVALDNLAVGIGIGVALGAALGAGLSRPSPASETSSPLLVMGFLVVLVLVGLAFLAAVFFLRKP